jgi:hypothetical protein
MLVGLMALSVGCSSGFKRYECAIGPDSPEPEPHAVWQCHRDIVRRAARGGKFTLLEFREATAFFERLTSIDAGAGLTEFGPVPTEKLKHSLDLWDEWYERNQSRLTWDKDQRTVRLGD